MNDGRHDCADEKKQSHSPASRDDDRVARRVARA
jgi:hypothetical protein